MKPAEISASLPKSRISVPAGSTRRMRSAGPKCVTRPSAMATIASGSWTIVFSSPSRNGSPVKVRAGPRSAVGRGDVAISRRDVRTEWRAKKAWVTPRPARLNSASGGRRSMLRKKAPSRLSRQGGDCRTVARIPLPRSLRSRSRLFEAVAVAAADAVAPGADKPPSFELVQGNGDPLPADGRRQRASGRLRATSGQASAARANSGRRLSPAPDWRRA